MPIDGNALDAAWIERYRQLAGHPNLYMKVSALMEQSTVSPAPTALDFYRPTLDTLWDAFGAERLLYGSNWPVLERAGSYAAAFKIVDTYFAEHGAAAVKNYFWRNAKSVYKWVER